MRLLPLMLSAHPSAWNADAEERQGAAFTDDEGCRFCGLAARGWLEPFHVNGDHADNRPANVLPGCALCHLTQHLDRPTIDEEVTLIWLPEMSQAALNNVVSQIHRIFRAHGEPPAMGRRPRIDTQALRAAYVAYQALAERGKAAHSRLGTTSAADLGAALIGLRPEAYERRAVLLAGVRLLGRGRLYRQGREVYPQLLDALPAAAD